jgi:hypothetical protein
MLIPALAIVNLCSLLIISAVSDYRNSRVMLAFTGSLYHYAGKSGLGVGKLDGEKNRAPPS